MGAMQRRKGAAFEREVARVFSDALGVECKRGLVQCRDSSEAPDVVLPPDLGLWVECKHHKKVNVHEAMLQAEIASDDRDDLAVVVHKDNGKRPLATMALTEFVKVVSRARESEQSEEAMHSELLGAKFEIERLKQANETLRSGKRTQLDEERNKNYLRLCDEVRELRQQLAEKAAAQTQHNPTSEE